MVAWNKCCAPSNVTQWASKRTLCEYTMTYLYIKCADLSEYMNLFMGLWILTNLQYHFIWYKDILCSYDMVRNLSFSLFSCFLFQNLCFIFMPIVHEDIVYFGGKMEASMCEVIISIITIGQFNHIEICSFSNVYIVWLWCNRKTRLKTL